MQQSDLQISFNLKFCIVGTPFCGKTCFRQVAFEEFFNEYYVPTSGPECSESVNYRNLNLSVFIFDSY